MKVMPEKRYRTAGKKSPLILVVAELLLAVILMRYMSTFVFIVSFPEAPSLKVLVSYAFSLILAVGMSTLTVNALLGIPSAKPRAWRKVMRSSVSLLAATLLIDLLSYFGYQSGGLQLSIPATIILSTSVFVVMCLPKVRMFYTPPMCECPPLKNWLMYATYIPLIGADTYKFAYGDETDGIHDIEEGFKT